MKPVFTGVFGAFMFAALASTAIAENKLTIAFATVGEKKVVDMFVELIQ